MTANKYVSCIKIAGCPILPPLVTENRRQELLKDKEAAKKIEEKLRICKTECSSDNEKAELCTSDPNCSTSSSVCSAEPFDTTAKLIEFIKNALSDVPDRENVQLLQNHVIEELKRHEYEQFDSLQSDSSDTLNNLESISPNDDKSLSEPVTNCTPLPKYDPLEQPQNSSSPNTDTSYTAPPAPVSETSKTPSKLIRSNSYVLESPTSSVIKFLKSITKEENESVEGIMIDERNERLKSVSKNLNEIWGMENVASQIDSLHISSDSESTQNAVETQCEENRFPEIHLIDFTSTQYMTDFPGTDKKDNNDNITAVPCWELPSHNKISFPNEVTEKVLKATVIIQSYIRGYLVRRLMKTIKVKELKNTIKDSLIYALALHTEQEVDSADVNLYVSLIRQVTAACYELHSIFFEWTTPEKMMLIHQDRIKAKQPRTPRTPRTASPKVERKTIVRRSSTSSNESRRPKNSFDVKSPKLKSPSTPTLKYRPWK